MASKESQAVSDLYRSWLRIAADPGWSQQDQRRMVEGSWGTLTTEPDGVDFAEADAGGVAAIWATPRGDTEDRVLFAIHGGGFISGSRHTHRKLFGHLAGLVGARALMPGYPLLPEGVHPRPVEAVLRAYRWLLDQGVDPARIAFAGDSVGGWLSVMTQLRARDEGLPLPAAALLMSPVSDLGVSGESVRSNAGKDALFDEAWLKQMNDLYLNGTSARDPGVDPLDADLTGLGPVYIQVGDQEMLLDDSRRLAEHLEKAGVQVRLDVFADQQHTFQMMAGRAAEADDAVRRMAEWVRPKLTG